MMLMNNDNNSYHNAILMLMKTPAWKYFLNVLYDIHALCPTNSSPK